MGMRHLLLHFARNGAYDDDLLVLERGEGPYVYDTDGRRYIDGLSSLFCCQIGYSYGEELGEVAAAQMRRLAFNTNWGTAHPPALELAARLGELAPGALSHAFFTSGGSEAVETAWKLVRQYHLANGEPQRTKAIARAAAYHGVTLGALSFTAVASMREPFGPPAIPVRHVSNTIAYRAPDGDEEAAFCARLLDEVERVVLEEGPDTVAAIVAEPVQNSGGSIVPPAGYWAGLREICDRHGILLVADEVITGFGRLGTWFGSQRVGAEPDLLTMAKGLTSAYQPMGGVLVSDRVAAPLYEAGRTLLHGVTFGGHPVAAAVALRNLEIFARDGVLENVRAHEQHLEERLRELLALPIVGDLRGRGFFWSFELVRDAATQPASRAGTGGARFDADERERLLRGFLPGALLDAGVIARGDDRGDSVLTLAPPLICDRDTLDELVDAVGDVLARAGDHMTVTTP